MKKHLLIIALLFITYNAYTQVAYGDVYCGFFLTKKDTVPRQDRLVFDLNHEEWLESPKGIELKSWSWGFGFSRMLQFPISANLSFAFGPGIRTIHHYHNGLYNDYKNANGKVIDTLMPLINSYSMNKTALNYLDGNVEIRIKAGRFNIFKLYLGFKGSYLFHNHLKHKDADGKFKRYNLNGYVPLTYGPTLRIGLNSFCLYAYYPFKPIFENNSKQKIQSLSLGITYYWL